MVGKEIRRPSPTNAGVSTRKVKVLPNPTPNDVFRGINRAKKKMNTSNERPIDDPGSIVWSSGVRSREGLPNAIINNSETKPASTAAITLKDLKAFPTSTMIAVAPPTGKDSLSFSRKCLWKT